MTAQRVNPKPLRIFHGPHNIGGIGRYLADWQRKQGAIADFIVYEDVTNKKNNHLNLHLEMYGKLTGLFIRLWFFLLCLFKYDLFHFCFGITFLPWNLDLPILKLFGKKMLMTYCGSEIRLVEVEEKRNPYAHFLNVGVNSPRYDKKKKRMMRWQNLWIDRFFAVRNLYASVASIIPEKKIIKDVWITNTIDIQAYTPTFTTNDIPTLVHAPTNPGIKGTAHIEEAIEALKLEGYKFNYIRLEKVPHEEAQRIFREEADIVINALYVGGFGNVPVEGMYYGKPVCGYVLEEIRREYPDLPIVNCTVDTLKDQLAWLIEHPEERIRLGKAGRAFVEKHNDREKINQELWQVYQELLNR